MWNEWGQMMSEGLGLWPGTKWIFALPSWLVPFLGFAPLLFVVAVKLLIELRAPRLSKQYKGLWPGDLFLSIAVGALLLGTTDYVPPASISPFWRSPLWDVFTVVLMMVAVLPLAIIEYASAIRDKDDPRSWTYTVYQLNTPSCLAHRLATVAYVYLITKVDLVALFAFGVPPFLKAIFIGGMIAWGYCVYLDNAMPRPTDLDAIHPRQKAWFRLA
jgi:hypothetical protein